MLDGQFDDAAIASDYTTFREVATMHCASTKSRGHAIVPDFT